MMFSIFRRQGAAALEERIDIREISLDLEQELAVESDFEQEAGFPAAQPAALVDAVEPAPRPPGVIQGSLHRQAEDEIRRDEILRGQRWSDEDRALLVRQRLRELEELDRLADAQIELERLKLEMEWRREERAERRHAEMLEALAQDPPSERLLDFVRAHPILTGFIATSFLGGRKKP
jgi:hypothetical protein